MIKDPPIKAQANTMVDDIGKKVFYKLGLDTLQNLQKSVEAQVKSGTLKKEVGDRLTSAFEDLKQADTDGNGVLSSDELVTFLSDNDTIFNYGNAWAFNMLVDAQTDLDKSATDCSGVEFKEKFAFTKGQVDRAFVFNFRGITTVVNKATRNTGNIIASIKSYIDEKIPAHLKGALKQIVFAPGRNEDDGHWEQKYGMPGFTAFANAGYGHITYFQQRIAESLYGLSHEFGHLLQDFINQKSPDVKLNEKWAAAMKKDGYSVSAYADKDPAEDFAETHRAFIEDKDKVRREQPSRFAILEKIYSDDMKNIT